MSALFKTQIHNRLRANVEAAGVICPTVLRNERELVSAKWFAYRFMSPLEATLEFGRCYEVALKRYIKQNVDVEMVDRVSGGIIRIPKKPDRAFSQLWLARQEADRHGIPYEDYLEFCLDFAAARQRRFAPRPGQLGPNEKTAKAWENKFERFFADRFEHILRNSPVPRQYRFEAFRGLRSQHAYREIIRSLISSGGHFAIATWCVTKRILPIRSSVDPKHRHLIRQAINTIRHDRKTGIASTKHSPLLPMTDIDYWPSCLGIPYAKEDSSSECSTCPFAEECEKVSRRVLQLTNTLESTNVEDAAKERKRAMSRERVRRHRARALLLSTQAVSDYKKFHSKTDRKGNSFSGDI